MATPSPGTIIFRGMRRRCGRCGGTGIFRSFFQLRERCPSCGYRFVREEGAFTGVLLLNITITFTLMFLTFAGYVAWRGITGDETVPFAPFVVVAGVFAVATPILVYPFAVASWAAFDLATRPLDDAEVLDATAAAEAEAQAAADGR